MRSGALELFRLFRGIWKLGEVVFFLCVETSALCYGETSGCFRGIWKLERLVWVHKNLGVWRGWKLGVCFWGDMETSGVVVLGVWKLGILAH